MKEVRGRGVSSAEDDLAKSKSTTGRWAIPGHERHGGVQVGFLEGIAHRDQMSLHTVDFMASEHDLHDAWHK